MANMTAMENTTTSASDEAEWITRLRGRGILDSAVKAGVYPDNLSKNPGWAYPVKALDGQPWLFREKVAAGRWKAFDSKCNPKYLWNHFDPKDGKPWNIPPYYFAPGFLEAVKAADGDAILASGEPDVWTWMALGYNNVFCWYGENSIPAATLVDDLRLWGVDMLHTYPDRDKPGNVAVAKVHKILNGKIAHRIWILPEALGNGGDINKAWQAAEFDPKQFGAMLASCTEIDRAKPEFNQRLALIKGQTGGSWNKAWELAGGSIGQFWQLVIHSDYYNPTTERAPAKKAPDDHNMRDHDMPVEYYRAIERALDPAMEFDSDGWTRKAFPCPMTSHGHDAERPAAYWHSDKHILKCFKCGDAVLAKDVASAVGIDWREFKPLAGKAGGTIGGNGSTAPTTPTEPEPAKIRPLYVASKSIDLRAPASYIPMPFRSIRNLGGLAEAMPFHKMTVLAAPSGNSKTTIAECMSAIARRAGYSVIDHSPEWTAQEKLWRDIQRLGGPTYMQQLKDLAYTTDRAAGVSHDICISEGKYPMSEDMTALQEEKRREIESWPGQCYYVEPGEFDDVMTGIEMARLEAESDGNPAWLFIFDYIQLYSEEYQEIMQYARRLKQYTMIRPIHGIIVSQIKRAASAEARAGTRELTADDMDMLKENVFNLALLSQREYSEADGKPLNSLKIKVAKNSVGIIDTVTLDLVPERLLVLDPLDRKYQLS